MSTRANILLTRNGQKTICEIGKSAYPESLSQILTDFDNWVSTWHGSVWNATYLYEINFDTQQIAGWDFSSGPERSLKEGIGSSIAQRIKQEAVLPTGWKLLTKVTRPHVTPYQAGVDAYWMQHQNDCRKLMKRTKTDGQTVTIGDILKLMEPYLKLHNLYVETGNRQPKKVGNLSIRAIKREGLLLTDYSIKPWDQVSPELSAPLVQEYYEHLFLESTI